MKIRIKRYSQNTILILCLFICPYALAFLTELLPLPTAVKYVFDFVWMLLLLTLVFKNKRNNYESTKYITGMVLIFFGYTVVNYLLHYQSIYYYFWGFRNTFRGLVLFLAVIYYLDQEDAEDCLRLMDKLFYLNAILAVIQYFVLGFKQDNLGGIFGVQSGCNGALNLYLCIMLVIYYVKYVHNNLSIGKLCVSFFIMLFIAAVAELKFFYIEFIVILIIASLFTKFSYKKLFIIVCASVALIVGYRFFVSVFPDTVISIEYLKEYAQTDVGYSTSAAIGRTSTLSYVNQNLLRTTEDKLLGFGMGNCDYASSFDLFTSPFYAQYEHLRYDWMSISILYLEQGTLGLILYFMIFVVIGTCAYKGRTTSKELGTIVTVLCFVLVIMLFYNNSMKVESTYLMYFVLALPWAESKRSACK